MNKSTPKTSKEASCFAKFWTLFSAPKTKEMKTVVQASIVQASMVIENRISNEERQEERQGESQDGIEINAI